MPPQPTATQTRLNRIATCLSTTTHTLAILSSYLKTPFLVPISNTTQSLLKCVQTVKQNKDDCILLLEQAYQLLNAIIILFIKSEMGGDLPPSVLNHIGEFMRWSVFRTICCRCKCSLFTARTLHKIHIFVETQQSGSKVKNFFRQGEMRTLLRDCKVGLQQGVDFFQIQTGNIIADVTEMQRVAEERHQEVLEMVEALSDPATSEAASSV
ncbi:hypothetical protein B0H19DRAFT_1241219 [Mycena capillaripes]|nr:hypothetical protein B0H19DRAFT_1241219 [Mycena capillaripes]